MFIMHLDQKLHLLPNPLRHHHLPSLPLYNLSLSVLIESGPCVFEGVGEEVAVYFVLLLHFFLSVFMLLYVNVIFIIS